MKSNNLNALRLIAAGLVLYGHSFVFLDKPDPPLFLSWLPLGALGLYIFFGISGYLVSQSWERDPHLLRFFARRGLRIFPGLVVCVLLSMLVLGPCLTAMPLKSYFEHPATAAYLWNIALNPVYALPGVFQTNPMPYAVNGSLWSLPVEFLMYIVVSLIGMISLSRWATLLLLMVSAMVALFWAHNSQEMLVIYGTDLRQIFICGTYFWAGATLYKFKLDRYFTLQTVFASCVVMLCLEPYPALLQVAAWGALPFVVLAFGLSEASLLARLIGNRDYSYGVYIYAFPVQQSVVFLYPELQLPLYVGVCCTVTLLMAALSWHFVEEKALRFKPLKVRSNQTIAAAKVSRGTSSNASLG